MLTERAFALEADAVRNTSELQAQLDGAVAQLAQYEAAEMGLAAVGGLQLPPGDDPTAAAAGMALPGELRSGAEWASKGGAGPGVVGRSRPVRALGLQALSARVAQLEADKAELARGLREAEGRARHAEGDLKMMRERLAVVGAPQQFVLERLAEAQGRAREAEAVVAALKVRPVLRAGFSFLECLLDRAFAL